MWNWNTANTNKLTQSLPTTGLIAQEVQEVLPEVVIERQDGYLAIDYSKMMGLIVEAIKELDAKINK
jgi:trimeric autotransporter adhesin